ncbi:S-layer homology domain-containing protein [Dielma fastidiosa]|uniref:S-layer homology domain-containing protein n=1 Tax=Dielma fastidiosa TaxID=1034346 RepID=UPI0023F540A5|nr:S-layer homology domain-containing protein [Dielma fastidiosa]
MKQKRIRALLLSTALVITQLPMVVMADDFETENTLVKSITDWTFINDEQLNNGNLNLDNISKENQLSFDEVVAMLPNAINAYIEDETSPSTIGIVGWSCEPFIQDAEDNWPLIGDYTFVAELASEYTLASEAAAIKVKVLLSGTNIYTVNNYIEQDGIKIIFDNGGEVAYTEDSGFTLKSSGGYTVSGTWNGHLTASAGNYHHVITVPSGVTANVTLDSVTIDVHDTDYAGAFLVAAGGKVNFNLLGTSTLASGHSCAGLQVPETAEVTLDGSGKLMATGGINGAGFGGGFGGDGGTIKISGGMVTATGNSGGAGIGGGDGGDGGTITISGGTVEAMGRAGGAGIGGGDCFNQIIGGGTGSGGTVSISGQGTSVTATGDGGYDVGSGNNSGSDSGSLSVTDGATLEMKNKGTNVSNPIYQNCTIIDKNGNRTEYNSNDNITLSTSSSGSIPKDSYKISGNSINQSITRTNLRRLANAGKSLTLESDMVVMSFDPAALKVILANTTGSKVTFTAMPADLSKSPEIKTIIGSHPAYDFSITYKNNKGVNVPVNAEFPAGSAAIQLNYTPSKNESLGSLFMVYIDDKSIEWLNHSSYHNGFMMAGVDHFSTYAIAYKISTPTYTDITDYWAKNDIEFVAARDLFTVSKTNELTPNASLTYAELITALGKLAGIQLEVSMTDIKADAAYAPYIDWAIQENIIPNRYELFNLNAPITREQMADVMMNYAKQIGYTILDTLVSMPFTDKNLISKESEKAVTALYQAGIIKGKDGNRFDPLAYVNRAEGSAMLHRFVEIMINPDTANGWVRNDSGHWLYYQAGNILTGWQTIDNLTYYFNSYGEMHEGWKLDSENEKWYFWTNDGAVIGWKFIYGKWYFFYEDGSMAANTIIEGYQLGSEGSIIYN